MVFRFPPGRDRVMASSCGVLVQPPGFSPSNVNWPPGDRARELPREQCTTPRPRFSPASYRWTLHHWWLTLGAREQSGERLVSGRRQPLAETPHARPPDTAVDRALFESSGGDEARNRRELSLQAHRRASASELPWLAGSGGSLGSSPGTREVFEASAPRRTAH